MGDCPSDDAEIAGGASELFVIRLVFELNVWQRTALGAVLSEARRRKDSVSIHHHDGRESDPSVTRRLSRGRSSAWLGREGGRGPAIRPPPGSRRAGRRNHACRFIPPHAPGALPGKAVLLEGHTSSRNLGGADWDWETDAERHRTWIRQQDTEFLRRTGMTEIIARHGAQYVNVTEAWWDGACASEEQVRSALGDVTIHHPELAGFVPSVLMELRGMPMLSVARFKGPTRLGISNLMRNAPSLTR